MLFVLVANRTSKEDSERTDSPTMFPQEQVKEQIESDKSAETQSEENAEKKIEIPDSSKKQTESLRKLT